MRSFAQKQNRSQKPAPSKVARTNKGTAKTAHYEHPILRLQRTIGNQAVLRMLQANSGEFKSGSTGTPSSSSGHNFDRVPLHSREPSAIQTKLAINQPGDEYEQEADRVSEQVMRMPEPQLQRACPCGGGCPKCQPEQPDHEHGPLITQAVPTNQLQPARLPLLPSPGSAFIQRSPDKPEVERKREQRIAELAKWPSEARKVWRKLDEVDRNLVVLQMAAKYAVPFAREFLKQVGAGKPQDDVENYFGPGVGPKQENLLAMGYQLAQKDSVHEWWVHPSGKSVTRNYTEDSAKPKEVKQVEPEEVDSSDLQEQALALLDEMRKLNEEMEELLKAEPVDMEEFVDKESDFRDLRGEIHDLIVQDPTILEDETGASIRNKRKALVDWFLRLRERAYRTEMPDFNKPSSE